VSKGCDLFIAAFYQQQINY